MSIKDILRSRRRTGAGSAAEKQLATAFMSIGRTGGESNHPLGA